MLRKVIRSGSYDGFLGKRIAEEKKDSRNHKNFKDRDQADRKTISRKSPCVHRQFRVVCRFPKTRFNYLSRYEHREKIASRRQKGDILRVSVFAKSGSEPPAMPIRRNCWRRGILIIELTKVTLLFAKLSFNWNREFPIISGIVKYKFILFKHHLIRIQVDKEKDIFLFIKFTPWTNYSFIYSLIYSLYVMKSLFLVVYILSIINK